MRGCRHSAKESQEHFFNAFKYIESITQYLPLHSLVIPVVQQALAHNVKIYGVDGGNYCQQFLCPKDFKELFMQGNFEGALKNLAGFTVACGVCANTESQTRYMQ